MKTRALVWILIFLAVAPALAKPRHLGGTGAASLFVLVLQGGNALLLQGGNGLAVQ